MVSLSAVVPATDAPPTLGRCLAAIAAADSPPDEVVVVDGPPGLSASGARNDGARRATGDVLVFVDADVEVSPDAFERIRVALSRPDLVAVFGSYDDAPGAPGVVATFRNLLHHHVHHESAGPIESFWTGLGAVRRADFLNAGGFDEARFPHASIEDVELGGRLARAGARIELDPTIQGKHLKAWTLRSMVWTDLTRRGVPWVALAWRERRAPSSLNLGWRHRLSAAACVTGVVAVARGRRRVALAALGALVALNHRLYRLLLRRQGPARAVAGVALHALHHLVAVVAVPVGIASAVRESSRDRVRGAPASR